MGCSAFCADDVGRAWASLRWPLSKANRQNAVTYRMASPLNENVSPFSFCMATLSEKDNWRNQAMSQACAVCSPVSWDFERNGDFATNYFGSVTSNRSCQGYAQAFTSHVNVVLSPFACM